MSKVAVSISIESDLVQALKGEAVAEGSNFSAYVVRLIELGRRNETLPVDVSTILEQHGVPRLPIDGEEPEDEEKTPHDLLPDQASLLGMSFRKQVLSCVTDEPHAAGTIAAHLQAPGNLVHEQLVTLVNAGEIMGKKTMGAWSFWRMPEN